MEQPNGTESVKVQVRTYQHRHVLLAVNALETPDVQLGDVWRLERRCLGLVILLLVLAAGWLLRKRGAQPDLELGY